MGAPRVCCTLARPRFSLGVQLVQENPVNPVRPCSTDLQDQRYGERGPVSESESVLVQE